MSNKLDGRILAVQEKQRLRRVKQGAPQKNKLGGRRLSFPERQRWKSLEQITPSINGKEKEEPIPIKPFDGIREIKPIDPSDYGKFYDAIRKRIAPSDNIKRAVVDFMINMFLNLPDSSYAPGKDYRGLNRENAYKQLDVFLNSLSGLEVIFGSEEDGHYSIGEFRDKKRYQISDLKELVESEFWDKKGDYHIVYLRSPFEIVEYYEAYADKSGISALLFGWEAFDLGLFVSEIDKKTQKEIEKILPALGVGEKGDLERVYNNSKKYLKDNPNMPDKQKEFLQEFIKVTQTGIQANEDTKLIEQIEAGRLFPDNLRTLVTQISQNITNNGILILESSKIKGIQGLRRIKSYDGDVSLYQRT